MNNENENYKGLRNVLLFCSFLFFFFLFLNHHSPAAHKVTKSAREYECVIAPGTSGISENHNLTTFKTLPFAPASFEFNKTKSLNAEGVQQFTSEKIFSNIKFFLGTYMYNQYFASGLHDPDFSA